MEAISRKTWSLLVAATALLLAFAFLGSRPIWDPDEGRYTNVALVMLDQGDWIDLARHHETGHWSKPPLTYQVIAASAALFGRNPWAVRLPMALSYLLTVWLVARIARRLVPGAEVEAALVYATMLLPFGASQVVTTDAILAAAQTLAVYAFVEARFGDRRQTGWWVVGMAGALAAAFMTKGPPALLPLLAIVALRLLAPSPRPVRLLPLVSGLALFATLAVPWFLIVARSHPGLLAYFLGAEVVQRVTGDGMRRHGEWYGWLRIYAPTLLIGTLPWTFVLGGWVRRLPAAIRSWRDRSARQAQAGTLFLTLWVLLPLLIFCVAKSRLPLYLLPLFAPLALLVARQRREEGHGPPRLRWLASWVVLLLGLKLGAAHWTTHKDASAWAAAIRERAPGKVSEVVFLEDMARYGIHLYLGAEVEKISLAPEPDTRFNPVYDDDLRGELAEREADVVWITKKALWPEVRTRLAALGYRPEALGGSFQDRVIFRVGDKRNP